MEAAEVRDDPRAAGRGPPELDRRLDRLGAGVREEDAVGGGRRDGAERLGQQAGQVGEAELRQARRAERERLLERAAHGRVVAADVEHPEAAEHVEEPRPVPVDQVRALGGGPLAVEADDLEHADEHRVRMARVELVALARARLQQLSEPELAHAAKPTSQADLATPHDRRHRPDDQPGVPEERPAGHVEVVEPHHLLERDVAPSRAPATGPVIPGLRSRRSRPQSSTCAVLVENRAAAGRRGSSRRAGR